MWYKISCWKPENNSQLLFSALHPGSSSAQESWQVLSCGQETLRTCPTTTTQAEKAHGRADLACLLVSLVT